MKRYLIVLQADKLAERDFEDSLFRKSVRKTIL